MIEEVARHYGYDRVGKTVPRSIVHGGLTVRQQRRRLLRHVLLGLGISEAMPNPFLAPGTQAEAGIDGPVISITNPLVDEESVLRTSLRPGLLSAVAFNESHRRFGARLFEIGHVYPPGQGELPDEYEALCVVLAGDEAPAAMAVWREISAALGVGARVDQSRVPAGLHAESCDHALKTTSCTSSKSSPSRTTRRAATNASKAGTSSPGTSVR